MTKYIKLLYKIFTQNLQKKKSALSIDGNVGRFLKY